MKKRVRIPNKIVYSKAVFFVGILAFLIVALRASQISLFNEIDHVNLKTMAASRNTKKEDLVANRGTIYDVNKETLAQNVASYTVIAYLDPKRSKGFKTPKHVEDKQMTAEKLAPILNMTEEAILALLNKNSYQVELGPGGRGITELKKDQIAELNLPGIDFVSTYKRYYPNGDFLSYVLGYAKQNESGEIVGEMGLEFLYNDKLKGENGYFEYQKDTLGYQIPNTPEIRKEPKNGEDIYLTIDSNVQRFLEQTVKANASTYHPEWILIAAMDAKTGAILGSASVPSFNPNTRDLTSYLNPLVANAYEPGSTMKTYTYMASIEKGNYNGADTFLSGEKQIEDQKVTDWKVEGWGNINFDQGFMISSNVGIANLIERNLSKNELKDFFKKLGFGSKTNITLPGEESGSLGFKYPIEVANAGFGQGITTTPIQHLKALTSIANGGTLLQPYIVDKIVDSNTNEVVFKGQRKDLGKVVSEETATHMKQLMFDTVNTDSGFTTANVYRMDGYDVIGKTGTAQIASTSGSGYLSSSDVIYSFAGMYPKDDPKIILYAAMSRPTWGKNQAVVNMVRDSITDISKYYNMFPSTDQVVEGKTFTLSSFVNQKTADVQAVLNQNTIPCVVIGDGDKVVKQYPAKGTTVSSYERVFLVTNGTKTIPDMTGYSTKEVSNVLDMLGVPYEVTGNGYVTGQSVPAGTVVTPETTIAVTLSPKFEG